ncbi:MAG TPA: hypothetical protein ENI23_03875 [bacterium]|nr:hypothetical protein [bacterium]
MEVPVKDINQIYREKDKDYLTFIQARLEEAKRQKEYPYHDTNGKTYYQIYEENEKIANTLLPPKKNDDDVMVSAGTVENKLDALLANINSLNLKPEVRAYDKNNNLIDELGIALEDTMEMTAENDGNDDGGDEEKKLLRQRELLKQGIVFVQEEWLRLFETKKILNKKYTGQFKDFTDKWSMSNELVYEGPGRDLLYGPNVFLGNMLEFTMAKQPYIFSVVNRDYDVAKAKYGKFENWEHVKKGAVPLATTSSIDRTIFDNNWRLTELRQNQVEIITYQDKTRDEFQIIINGVMMMPVGFPLSAMTPGGDYNIAKQIFRPINHKFAYGSAFVASGAVKQISALIDEMLKLFVLKTRKSFTPAYINTSGRVISKKVLTPGRITMGIPPEALQKIGEEGQGVTTSEFGVLRELQDRIDKATVSNIFQGQQAKGGTTATEIIEVQKQAKLTLGLAIAACVLLEQKVSYLRLWNLLENWFNPIDTKEVVINDVRKYVNQFRNTNREVNIDGEGLGNRQVIPTDEKLPDAQTIRDGELAEEKRLGHPVRKIFLNPKGLKAAKLRWFIVVVPKEKESSAIDKVMFREMFADLTGLMQLGSIPNLDTIEDEFSRLHSQSRNKLFRKGGGAPPALPEGSPGSPPNFRYH